MGTSTIRSNIKSITILYSDNQPVDPNLWDGFFFLLLIFGIDEFLDKDSKNITCSFQKIGSYIK